MINLYHNSHSRDYRKYTQAHEWGCFYIRSISSRGSCICITISALFIIWALRDKNPICEGAKATRTVEYKNSSLNLNICIRKTCEVFSLENVILKQEGKSKTPDFFFCVFRQESKRDKNKEMRERVKEKVATSMNISVLMSLGPWIRDIVLFRLFQNPHASTQAYTRDCVPTPRIERCVRVHSFDGAESYWPCLVFCIHATETVRRMLGMTAAGTIPFKPISVCPSRPHNQSTKPKCLSPS